MRNKLKKDLKFLRTWKGKLPTSLAISLIAVLILEHMRVVLRSDDQAMFGVIIAIIAYVVLYFFNAWIVGDESSNVEN
jgi:hypothetical protein